MPHIAPPHQRRRHLASQRRTPSPWAVIVLLPLLYILHVTMVGSCATELPLTCTDHAIYAYNIVAVQHCWGKTDDNEGFLVTVVYSNEEIQLYRVVPYYQQWKQKSGLYLKTRETHSAKLCTKTELGPFIPFIKSFSQYLRTWTSHEILVCGKNNAPTCMDKLVDFLGLELAVYTVRSNKLKVYWSSCEPMGSKIFEKLRSRNGFLNIRVTAKIYSQYNAMWRGDPLVA